MSDANDLYKQGRATFTDDRARAGSFFARAVEIDPNFQEAWFYLALCTDEVKEQQRFLHKAKQINEDNEVGQQAAEMLMQLENAVSPPPDGEAHAPDVEAALSDESKHPLQAGVESGDGIITEATLHKGQLLAGKYEIIEALPSGKGGFGKAYLARFRPDSMYVKRFHDQICVVKQILLPRSQEMSDRERTAEALEREADLLITLNQPSHESIPHFIDYLGPQQCLVMQHIDGDTLETKRQRKRRKKLPPLRTLRYARDVCSALAYMHYHKEDGKLIPKIHRDVKPENIVIGPDGRAWLVDYGIAQAAMQADPNAQFGAALGTRGYMPPEQLQGDTEPRSDVYALCVTLRTLLTGQEPSVEPVSETMATYDIKRSFRLRDIFTVRPRVERLIQRGTSPEIAERPTSRGLLAEIDQILALHAAYTTARVVSLLLLISIFVGTFASLTVRRAVLPSKTTQALQSIAHGPIRPGQPITSSLDQAGPPHLWIFEGLKDTRVTISAKGDPADGTDPVISLIGPAPANGVRDSDDNSAGGYDALIDKFPVDTDGIYTILVAAATQGGKFRLSLEISNTKPIVDESNWTFDGRKDDTLSVNCKSGDTASNTYRPPDIALLDSARRSVSGANNKYTLPKDDRYTFQIKSTNTAKDVCQFAVSSAPQKDASRTIKVGDRLVVDVTEPGIAQSWELQVDYKQVVTVSCQPSDRLRHVHVFLLDSKKQLVTPWDDEPEIRDVELEQGVYTVRVTAGGETTGTCLLLVQGG